MSETGWSNSDVFQTYLSTFFFNFIHCTDECPVLLLYDGHKSHITLNVIEWAKAKNVILFVLPPHTSQLTQPLDVGVFGPFRRVYNQSVQKFKRQHPLQAITKYNITSIICNAYLLAFTPTNLIGAFRKAGVMPFKPSALPAEATKPSEVFVKPTATSVDDFLAAKSVRVNADKDQMSLGEKKERCYLKVGGRAITEEEGYEKVKEHNAKRKGGSCLNPGKGKGLAKKKGNGKGIDYSQVCCHCELLEPACTASSKIDWVECDNCGHWVHAPMCTSSNLIPSEEDVFLCRCCEVVELVISKEQ
jgi:hypothetical protein